jgi:hypothetical protein
MTWRGCWHLRSTSNCERTLPFRPGYDITERLLIDSPLLTSILTHIVEGVDGSEKHFAEEESYFSSTIIRISRIIQRVLEIQDIFIDTLTPILSESDSAPIIGT